MKTFLLAWNPKRWDWDDIDEAVEAVRTRGFVDDRWSCGRSKRIEKGDRVFLLRQGILPKGIMAAGAVTSESYEGAHWDKHRSGEKALYIDVRFDTLLHPQQDGILDRAELSKGNLANVHWDTQMSGIQIPHDAAAELEVLWSQFLVRAGQNQITLPEEVITPEQYFEGSTRQISVNIYERNPHARQKCIDHYGLRCSVCDFDFRALYGDIGQGFIHVHHLKPLSEIQAQYRIDPIKDLRPVCPNCHAMIHRPNTMLSIGELRKMLSK